LPRHIVTGALRHYPFLEPGTYPDLVSTLKQKGKKTVKWRVCT